ncbi:11014_t:CDS:2, partial [Funneliformis geosporum]
EYNEELGLAFEYSGNQHYQIVPFFHLQDQVNLDTQIWRDWAHSNQLSWAIIHIINNFSCKLLTFSTALASR